MGSGVARLRPENLLVAGAFAALGFGLSCIAGPTMASDVDARTMAFIHDVAAGDGAQTGNASAAAVEAAREALRRERLLSAQRVATVEPGVLADYSRALMLGTRGPQFASQIGQVRDAVLRGDRDEIASAIGDVYEAAGRNRPTGAALDRLVAAVGGAASAEGPPESVRRTYESPGQKIEIADARRAGLFTVDVTTEDASGEPVRTVFIGEQDSRPNAQGTDLEQRMALRTICTIDATQAAAMRAELNGEWIDGGGERWTISGDGERISLTRTRSASAPPSRYVGTFRLGRVEARHAIRSSGDLDARLPGWVRAGLAAWSPTLYFVVRLDSCPGRASLDGTWQSQHVTYSPNFQTINRVHDPYELRLTLTRTAPARGLAALP